MGERGSAKLSGLNQLQVWTADRAPWRTRTPRCQALARVRSEALQKHRESDELPVQPAVCFSVIVVDTIFLSWP